VEPQSYKNATSNLLFFGLDSTDINYRILQYHNWFDTFVAYYERPIAQGQFLTYLDTFKIYAAEAYKNIEDVYFITYVRYDIAEMEQSAGGNASSSARLNTFMNYIEPFPVYFENDRYMKFVLAFYNKDFGDYLPDTEASIRMAIYNSSPTRLMAALKKDIFLSKSDLREMIMIDKLGKAFYKEFTAQGNILMILDSISNHAGYEVNATIARNVKNYLTSLETGFPAPKISLTNKKGETIDWGNYQGKFVYFNFFATWNKRSLAEMKIISNLVTKYNEDIAFLSVCTDKEQSTFDTFMEANPQYDWEIIYIGENRELMNAYKVKDVPAYYLIDQDGFIFSAPALSPSPSGEYESIDKTFFYIKKALHPVQTQRVGEK
jgi:thiol-disulfide isomerase/thioredoxin